MAECLSRDPVDEDDSVLPLEDLRSSGLLWAINKVLLHPRGFALALHYPPDATLEQIEDHTVQPTGWSLVGDGTEAWQFKAPLDDQGFAQFEAFLARHRPGPTSREMIDELRARLAAHPDGARRVAMGRLAAVRDELDTATLDARGADPVRHALPDEIEPIFQRALAAIEAGEGLEISRDEDVVVTQFLMTCDQRPAVEFARGVLSGIPLFVRGPGPDDVAPAATGTPSDSGKAYGDG